MKHPSERLIVLLVATFQFINILDFMIVMPLGPQFASELGIAENHLGMIAGSYTLAGAIAGIVGSFFLDRFDRRKALAVAMLGLVCGTALGGFAVDLFTLLSARVIAGIFGGPATSLALALIADVIAPARRGRAMATVMMAFSMASIVGVPLALEIAHYYGWPAPFFAVSALGVLVSACALWWLPPMKGHLESEGPQLKFWHMFTRKLPLLACGSMACMMISAWILIPVIPSFVLHNLDYTGEPWIRDLGRLMGYEFSVLGPLYFFGGLFNFVMLLFIGRVADKVGSSAMSFIGAAAVIFIIYAGYMHHQPWFSAMALYVSFMVAGTLRGVPSRALDTRVPLPHERAGFMSAQSAVQHITLGLSAGLSSLILVEGEGKDLVGMEILGWIAIPFAALMPVCVLLIERGLRARDAQGPVATSSQPASMPTLAPMVNAASK